MSGELIPETRAPKPGLRILLIGCSSQWPLRKEPPILHDKIIFLDVDGVLNTQPRFGPALRSESIALLGEIVRKTGASLVVSSTWRLQEQDLALLRQELTKEGIGDRIIGATPVIHVNSRDEEILQWLAANPTRRFAILDDSPSFGSGDLHPHYFQVSSIVGLQTVDVEAVIRPLNDSR
jgi:hypothetical protein